MSYLTTLNTDGKNYAASPTICPLCGGQALPDQGCVSCFAPSEVLRSILSRMHESRVIGVLGPSGVGKTVYLGMLLDLLSRGVGGLHGLARGPFSLALQRNLILALERQRFPGKTPVEADHWQWVHCEVSGGKKSKVCDIVTPDVAGEAVMAEIESPGSYPTVRCVIERCAGLVILADILQVIADGQGQELFAMQLITYLDSLRSTRRRQIDLPVAIVFTKADLSETPVYDPVAFARANAPALLHLCEARLKKYRLFCCGVAGSCGRLIDAEGRESLVPLRVEPRGIVEPFAWLLSHLG